MNNINKYRKTSNNLHRRNNLKWCKRHWNKGVRKVLLPNGNFYKKLFSLCIEDGRYLDWYDYLDDSLNKLKKDIKENGEEYNEILYS
jgi:predicted ATP-dependent Lon-type protease